MSAIYLHLAISNFMVTSCRPSHRYIMSHDRDRNWPAIGPWYSALWPWRRSKGQQPSLFWFSDIVISHNSRVIKLKWEFKLVFLSLICFQYYFTLAYVQIALWPNDKFKRVNHYVSRFNIWLKRKWLKVLMTQ